MALIIHIVSCKSLWYESSFFAVRIRTLNQTEYLPNEFFTLLTLKLWDEINGRHGSQSRYNVLRVLNDTINSGKFHMEIDRVILQRLYRWLAQADVEQRNSQSTPPRVRSIGLASPVPGVRPVQKMCYLRYVIHLCIVGIDFF